MRLGTCIALELAMATTAVFGVWIGATRALEIGGDYFASREAVAATQTPVSVPETLPRADLHVEVPIVHHGTVFPESDATLLASLGGQVTRVKLNNGTSLSLRLDFASGARAAFKPEQVWPQSDPRREIAAYRMDRMLGLGHVAPVKPAQFTLQELVAAADPSVRDVVIQRLRDEAIGRNGVLRGELQWWIPDIRDARIGKFRVDELDGIVQWTGYLKPGGTIPAEYRAITEQLAMCVMFDILIDNADRWTGWNTKASPDQSTLYFMDNTMAFSLHAFGHDGNLFPLHRMQVFPRGLVEKFRALTLDSVTATLEAGGEEGGLAPLLTKAEIRAIILRRDHLLEYVDGLIAQFGEAAVLALP